MAVIFSHSTALGISRSIPPQARMLKPVVEPLSLAVASTRSADLSKVDLTAFGLTGEVHVLVGAKASRTMPKGVIAHSIALKEIPGGLLYELEPNVYVCGPELVFLQMASELSDIGLTILGYELCGSYSQFARLASGFYDRRPLTSTRRITEALDSLPRLRGLGRSRSALAYVRDGSRSPMETVVSAMLYLPVAVGGYGLAMPTLNRRVTLDAAASARLGKKSCAIDACWPDARIGLEYDSTAFHPDPEKDRLRSEALAHMGWTIYTLSPDDVSDVASLDRMVDLFVDRIPRIKPSAEASPTKRAKLLNRLFVLTRRGLGVQALVFAHPTKTRGVAVHL